MAAFLRSGLHVRSHLSSRVPYVLNYTMDLQGRSEGSGYIGKPSGGNGFGNGYGYGAEK